MALFEQTQQQTVQSRVKDDTPAALDILQVLVRANELLPPWWSRTRDIELGKFWKGIDHVSAAISMFISKTASIPLEIRPRDRTIKAHVKQADMFNAAILEGSDFGQGWIRSLAPRLIESYITKDNGCFAEIIGEGKPDQPRRGFFGLAHLDSDRCRRTGNPEYPVNYVDTDGKMYRLHHTRVMYAASLPSQNALMNGVGFCAVSRMTHNAQHIRDIGIYEQEKLGSRPHRQMIVGRSGITAQEIVTAFQIAEQGLDNQNLSRYAKSVVIGGKTKPNPNNPIDISVESLSNAPDGFDKEKSITLAMFLIALALNIPPRWIWPATQAGATKADAMFQHVAGMGGGVGLMLGTFVKMLGGGRMARELGKPIPPHLKVVFDFQDDEQDQQQAEIREKRATTREKDLAAGAISIRVAREQMLEAGDITEEQFNQLELADGRLPDGGEVLALFDSAEPFFVELLDLGVADPLNVAANDAELMLLEIAAARSDVQAQIINDGLAGRVHKAQMALAALDTLQAIYEQAVVEVVAMEPESEDSESPEEEESDAEL